METKEIPSKRWEKFFERINDLRRQALLTVEVFRDGQKEQIARELPLQKIELDRSDGCSDRVALHLGIASQRPMTPLIIEPIHIVLRSTENGSFNPLEIDAESGVTLVTFHPALRPDILQGIEN
jgi:hypothetical protein